MDAIPRSSASIEAARQAMGVSNTPAALTRPLATRIPSTLAAFVVVLGVVLGLQGAGGAFSGELSGLDEAAHYVTGVMIRDYVASGFHASPMAFAVDYYAHYPKVAFGIWPPLFHVVQAGWMLVAPVSPASVFVLLATTLAILSTMIFVVGRRLLGTGAGLGAAVLFAVLPITRFTAIHVLADAQVALLDFAAVVAWARFLETEGRRESVAFGILASLSMLTKGNGLALFFVPAIATALAGRLRLVKHVNFWLGPVVMLVLGLPWQIYSWSLIRGTVNLDRSMSSHLISYLVLLVREAGPVILGCAVVGLVFVASRWRRERSLTATWSAVIALPIAVILFHAVTPLNVSDRYLLPALSCITLLAAAGVESIAGLVFGASRPRAVLVAAALIALCFTSPGSVAAKEHYGYAEVAEALMARPGPADSVILISAPGDDDGMLVSEMVTRDRRPGHFVVRANKVLSRSNWDGGNYELLYKDTAAINRFLTGIPVDLVVLDDKPSSLDEPHRQLLADTMRANSDDWTLIGDLSPDGGRRVVVYAARHPSAGKRHIEIDMKYSLGHSITAK